MITGLRGPPGQEPSLSIVPGFSLQLTHLGDTEQAAQFPGLALSAGAGIKGRGQCLALSRDRGIAWAYGEGQ